MQKMIKKPQEKKNLRMKKNGITKTNYYNNPKMIEKYRLKNIKISQKSNALFVWIA